jgi:hypothetical protein
MTREDIEREVLELVEEDFYGVWEIGWRLHTALGVDPTVDPEQAAEVVEALRRQHLVEIYVREWVDDNPRPISSSVRSIDLREASAWLAPGNGDPEFLVGLWDAGDAGECT